MITEQTTENTNTTGKKRNRLTLEEQIARQEELLAKDKEKLAKKQKRLRSLNASKMNKDRIQAQKKRNSMLIQLGLYLIEKINKNSRSEREDYIDITEEVIEGYIEDIESEISDREEIFEECFGNGRYTKEAKYYRKLIDDKYILLNAFKNMKENYLKCGKAKIL